MDPLVEVEPELALLPEVTELQKAKLVVALLRSHFVGLMSKMDKIVEAVVFFLQLTSILNDQKLALVSLRD